jgi:uncharacterized low-complexity protein
VKLPKKSGLAAIMGLLAFSVFASTIAKAETNPFAAQNLVTFTMESPSEGKCGESKAKCGESKGKAKTKCGEGKCGESKAKAKSKCGEGKCGESKGKAKAKCGEGKNK